MKTLLIEFLKIFDTNWFSNHFLYFAGLAGIVILSLLFLIIRRLNKESKQSKEESRKKMVDFMRKTSPRNKPERKRLKF